MSNAVVQRAPESTHEETEGDCPECNGTATVDGQETVCQECGLVLEDTAIDRGPEWCLADARSRSRVGSPNNPMVHDKGLHTYIGLKEDANGTLLSPEKRRRLNRQRTHNSWARFRSKIERNRRDAFGEINRMGSALGVGNGRREQACQLFKTAQEADLIKGRSIEAMAGAALYAVGRLHQDQYLLTDVETVARVGKDAIANAYGVLNRELAIPTPPPKPRQYLGRLCSDLGLEEAYRRAAGELLDDVDEHPRVATCKPVGVAAGAVYVATDGMGWEARPSQDEIGAVADVAPSTIRERARDIEEVAGDGE